MQKNDEYNKMIVRYDLYRSVHKFIRKELYQFGGKLGTTDFRKILAITSIKDSFDNIVFDLKMHAQKEEKYFTPLFEKKQSIVHKQVEQAHFSQQNELVVFQGLFETAIKTVDDEERVVQGRHICSSYDEFLSDNLLHFYQEENILMPELWKLYSDKELQQVTIDSYKGLPEEVLLDSSSFFPVLNFFEKRTYLQDIKEACSPELFLEIWKRSLVSEGCFTTDEKSAFAIEFDLPLSLFAAQKNQI
ncbi:MULTISPECIES: hemerythrin domain-containing protein [Rickettsieae]|uniref:hemerythrin domain-containing protein n=1 Tax=Rickettsieae TaxID=33988 RepID=UPI000B9C393A|nr:hemerythrin domain-containing protein [Rickettsia endosymbiont of Culicoides newsteadi]